MKPVGILAGKGREGLLAYGVSFLVLANKKMVKCQFDQTPSRVQIPPSSIQAAKKFPAQQFC
jgi:hypothetical protein